MNRALLLLSLLALTPAWADTVDVSLQARTQAGKNYPSISIHILEPIAGFELKLKRQDGEELNVRGGGKPGVTRTLDLPQPEGKFHWAGELRINAPDGEVSTMPLQFDTEMYGNLKIAMEEKAVDVANRKLSFRVNRPIVRAHLNVVMDSGKVAFDGDIPFHEEPAGTPLDVTWPEAKGRVLKVALQVFDSGTFFTGVEVFPWQIDIPHEEVVFDSGRSAIRGDQEPRLSKSYDDIDAEITRYGSIAPIKLYIVGHTDTVGDKGSNRTLSLERARSIGAYLRKRGIRIPIFYEGFGEEAPRVGTPDETAEERNRRAEYVITVSPPTLDRSPFKPNWRKL